jgi:hypothetical protein
MVTKQGVWGEIWIATVQYSCTAQVTRDLKFLRLCSPTTFPYLSLLFLLNTRAYGLLRTLILSPVLIERLTEPITVDSVLSITTLLLSS